MTMLQDLRLDARFFHQICFLDRQPTFLSWIKVLLRSRGLFVLAVHRLAHNYYVRCPSGSVKFLFALAVHLGNYLSKLLAKSEILSSTQFEPGVYLSNRGHIILGARIVGTGTLIHERVTIGMNLMNRGIPEIGRDVWIGPHSVISGDIKIGDGVTVLPYSVLTKSLPNGVVVQGNPARIVKRDFDNSKLRCCLAIDVGHLLNKVT
jgi:serine O-acetyltransferase